MKKIVAALVAAIMLGVASPSHAVDYASTTRGSVVTMNVLYAKQIILCDSNLGFADYQNAVFFDNNGACIDPSSFIAAGGNLEQWLTDTYPGGLHNWTVKTDTGTFCNFKIINGQPVVGQLLVWDTFFTACAVKLNQKVTTGWSLLDTSTGEVYVSACLDGQIGFYDNCLDIGDKPSPYNASNILPGTVDYINEAANKLKIKFRFDYRGWLTYNKKFKKLRFTMSKSPVAVKLRLQKWVDYKWVTVQIVEKMQIGKIFFDYNRPSAGKYRLHAVNAVGKTWTSKPVVIV